MRYNSNDIRKRRRDRIRKIGQSNERTEPSTVQHNENRSFDKPSFFRVQMYIGICLILFVVLINQSQNGWALSAKSFTKQAVTQDYNFKGASAWIEERLGQFPSILPTIQFFTPKEAIPVFSPPLTGVVVEGFSPALTGVIIETGVKQEVHPIGPGWVRSVAKKKGMGTVVVIQHGDGKESTYGFLEKALVKKNDWVYPDRVVGVVEEQSLFLQIRDKKAYIDPMDVVQFD